MPRRRGGGVVSLPGGWRPSRRGDPPGSCGAGAANATCSTGSSTLFAPVGAGPSWSAGTRAWARRRSWTTWPSGRRAAGWRVRRASSRRWSSPSPGCTSCARRCWTAWSGCRARSRTRCGRRSASAPGRRRTASWSGWPPSSLLSDVAEERPLVCLVDDAQWLDRRLGPGPRVRGPPPAAESVGLVFARPRPERRAGGVAGAAGRGARRGRCARAAGVGDHRAAGRAGPRPDRRRDARQPAGAGGAAPGLDAGGAGRRVRASRRDAAVGADRGELPAAARGAAGRHAAVAAGRGGRAGRRPGAAVAGGRAARHRHRGRRPPAAEAGLLEVGARVRFRHPLVRSAAYRSASLQERQEVHRALAEVDRPGGRSRSPGLAPGPGHAGPDEDVAAELERSAEPGAGPRRPGRRGRVPAARRRADARARRGGPSARWPPRRRGSRRAPSTRRSGCWPRRRPERSTSSSAPGSTCCAPRSPSPQPGSELPPLLLEAARRLEPFDLELARETYLTRMGRGGHRRRPRRRGVLWRLPRRSGRARLRRRSSGSPRPAARRPGPADHRGTRRQRLRRCSER